MPPRQPLRLNRTAKPKAKPANSAMADMAAQLLQDEVQPAIQPKKTRLGGFSLYPDLSMAISMLAKRQQAVANNGERAKLVSRWLAELQSMQQEMQKLHKLEQLAERLGKK